MPSDNHHFFRLLASLDFRHRVVHGYRLSAEACRNVDFRLHRPSIQQSPQQRRVFSRHVRCWQYSWLVFARKSRSHVQQPVPFLGHQQHRGCAFLFQEFRFISHHLAPAAKIQQCHVLRMVQRQIAFVVGRQHGIRWSFRFSRTIQQHNRTLQFPAIFLQVIQFLYAYPHHRAAHRPIRTRRPSRRRQRQHLLRRRNHASRRRAARPTIAFRSAVAQCDRPDTTNRSATVLHPFSPAQSVLRPSPPPDRAAPLPFSQPLLEVDTAAAAASASTAIAPCCKPMPPALAPLGSNRLSKLCRTYLTGCDASSNIPPCSEYKKIPVHPHRQRKHGRYQTTASCLAPAASIPSMAPELALQFPGPDNCHAAPASALCPFPYRAPALQKSSPDHSCALPRTASNRPTPLLHR